MIDVEKRERKPQTYKAARSRYDNCVCDSCFGIGTVTKFKLPYTCYHDRRHLTTKHTSYWICDECKQRLIEALENPEED